MKIEKVAQPGGARAFGARGPGFKSRRGRQVKNSNLTFDECVEKETEIPNDVSLVVNNLGSKSESNRFRTNSINSMQIMFARELSDWAKVELVRSALKRFTAKELSIKLNKSLSTIYRYAKGELIPNEEVIAKLLGELGLGEALRALGREFLCSLGKVIGSEKLAFLALLKLALDDPLLKKLLLEWISIALGEELSALRTHPGIVMSWSEEFEEWLRNKVSHDRVMYYKRLFMKNFQGKILNEETVKYASKLSDWTRVVFRHYLRWLAMERKISVEFLEWALMKVPTRRYEAKLRIHEIEVDEVRKTLEILKDKHPRLYWIYRLLIESGLRLTHALELMRLNFNEEIYIEPLGKRAKRCEEFDEFVRCWIGVKRGKKGALWAYFSKETFEAIKDIGRVRRDYVSKKAKELGILAPMMMRKFVEQNVKAVFANNFFGEEPSALMAFMQGRTGELKVSHLHYDNLLKKMDALYPRWLTWLKKEVLAQHP